MAKRYRLKKQIGLFEATFYGVGIIIGAGIYTLIGAGAGVAGNMLWLSFVIAGFLAFFTGLSYAELSSMYPKDAAEYVYTKKAFRKEYLSFMIEWVMLFTVIVSGATVALGFAGYFTHMFGGSLIIAAAGLIILLTALNYVGIKISAEFNIASTLIEMAGLLIVIALGVFFLGKVDYFSAPPSGMTGVMSGMVMIFFAYLGFEAIVNLSEETKNPRKNIPKAIVLSLAISTVLYILVSASAIGILGADRLASSQAPLTDVVGRVIPNTSLIFSLIALFATANTVLVTLIVASRILYGLANNHKVPLLFGKVDKRNAPYVSILIVMILSIAGVLLSGIQTIALLTDIGLFLVYISVNMSLIWLRYREPRARRGFRSPVNIGRFPVLAFLGVVASAATLFFFDPMLLFYELIVIASGFAVYKLMRKKK